MTDSFISRITFSFGFLNTSRHKLNPKTNHTDNL